jgi:hypothetical protein
VKERDKDASGLCQWSFELVTATGGMEPRGIRTAHSCSARKEEWQRSGRINGWME